jgi:hypothetical protein
MQSKHGTRPSASRQHLTFTQTSKAVVRKDPVLVDCHVGKHAHPDINYVTGWTLYRASKALTMARDKGPLFLKFSKAHYIDEDMAQSLGLPSSLGDRRKHSPSVYCSRDYFEFMCFNDSLYLANLLMKMMMAYADGDIIAQINMSMS